MEHSNFLTAEIVIEPSRGWVPLKLGELWQYRELLFFLVWRDTKVRYKQASLGVAWAVIQPLMTMVIFSVIFGELAKLPSENIPYPLFSYAALLPWQLFSGALTRSGSSLVGSATLLTKVYFPRLIIPLSTTIGGLVDFSISFLVLLGLMLFYGMAPTWAIFWLPLLVVFTLVTALSVGLWLSALNVRVPRCAAHHPVYHPGVDVRIPCCILGRINPLRSMAIRIWTEPSRRSHSELPMGPSRGKSSR